MGGYMNVCPATRRTESRDKESLCSCSCVFSWLQLSSPHKSLVLIVCLSGPLIPGWEGATGRECNSGGVVARGALRPVWAVVADEHVV